MTMPDARSVTLYEISDMRAILDAWLDETEGEVTPELEALLAEYDALAKEKVERVALYIRECEARADVVGAEVERLRAREKRERRAADSLRAYLHRELERQGVARVDGLLCTVALQKGPLAVRGDATDDELEELAMLEPWCGRTHYAVDRGALLKEHRAGRPLPTPFRVEQTTSLRIR